MPRKEEGKKAAKKRVTPKLGRLRQEESYWISLVKAFETSSLPLAMFCVKKGVALSTFGRWKKKIGCKRPPPPPHSEGKICAS